MKKTHRAAGRKIKTNLFLLIGVSLLVVVGAAFFATLFTISTKYEQSAEKYFEDYNYADCTLYGSFTDEQADQAGLTEGIKSAQGRYVKDYRDGDKVIRAVSITKGINDLYLYTGSLPEDNECAVVKKCAEAAGFKIGDRVSVNGVSLKISGIVDSPEYIYLVKNERDIMSDPEYFSIIFTAAGFFSGNYNEIVLKTSDGFDSDSAAKTAGAARYLLKAEQANYTAYRDDIGQIQSFAYIFPAIFAALIFAVVAVILKRAAVKDRKQIAVWKALGAGNKDIAVIYLTQFFIFFIAAAVLGCALSIPVTGAVIGIFSSMFAVPTLVYQFYPLLWAVPVILAAVLCIAPGLLALRGVFRVRPAEAMRPPEGRRGKKIVLERLPRVWKKLSFNTRYTVKSMLRSKGRFFAVVLGITATTALLMLSFGFYNSVDNTKQEYFRNFADYDMIISLDRPEPLSAAIHFTDAFAAGSSADKALQLQTKVNGDNCLVTMVDSGFDKLKIDFSVLSEGVIIPEYYAARWNVKAGGIINIEGKDFYVSAVINQPMAVSIFASYDYVHKTAPEIPSVYNTVYYSGETAGLRQKLDAENISYATIYDDMTSFDSISESMDTLIILMLLCAVILGVAVLYCVGLISFSSREGEYTLIRTLGYGRGKIMSMNIKESVIQLILSIPLGFLTGVLLLNLIKGEFSNSSFVLAAKIYPISYLISTGIVIGISGLMSLAASRRIGKLDIVEGLKTQNE